MANLTFEEITKAKMLAAGLEPKNSYHIRVYGQLGEENYKTIRELVFRGLCQKADITHKKSLDILKGLDSEIDSAMQRVSMALSELEKREIRLGSKKIPKLEDDDIFHRIMAQLFSQYTQQPINDTTVSSRTIDRLIL